MKDKSNKIKKIIIILVVMCIILGIIVKNISTKDTKKHANEMKYDISSIELNKIEKVQIRSDYLLVKECIEKFYSIKDGNIYNLLDNEYIQTFNIKKDNIQEKFDNFNNVVIDITKMYSIDISYNVRVYFAYGYLIDVEANSITDLAIGVKIDMVNSTFSILPYEYLDRNNYLNINEKSVLNMKEETEIENKNNNTFKYSYINDKAYIDFLFKNYINRCIYNIESMYNYLDLEYRQKRFGNLQEFVKFVEKNKNMYMAYDLQKLKKYNDFENMDEYLLYLAKIDILEIESYQKTNKGNYTQYICIDNYNNYYIFRETAPMEYTLILDTYTIDLPEFTSKYETATTEEKVALNIQKIVEALNSKDYNYIYEKLADEFKANYFKTYEDFEKYAKTTFDVQNVVTFMNYTESENYSTYEITLKGKSKTITKTIVMKLEEGTNFVMSFNVN